MAAIRDTPIPGICGKGRHSRKLKTEEVGMGLELPGAPNSDEVDCLL